MDRCCASIGAQSRPRCLIRLGGVGLGAENARWCRPTWRDAVFSNVRFDRGRWLGRIVELHGGADRGSTCETHGFSCPVAVEPGRVRANRLPARTHDGFCDCNLRTIPPAVSAVRLEAAGHSGFAVPVLCVPTGDGGGSQAARECQCVSDPEGCGSRGLRGGHRCDTAGVHGFP